MGFVIQPDAHDVGRIHGREQPHARRIDRFARALRFTIQKIAIQHFNAIALQFAAANFALIFKTHKFTHRNNLLFQRVMDSGLRATCQSRFSNTAFALRTSGCSLWPNSV